MKDKIRRRFSRILKRFDADRIKVIKAKRDKNYYIWLVKIK
jgi:hypothetical protein